MSKIKGSKKLTITTLALLIVGSLFAYKLFTKDTQVARAWMNDSYHYRQSATVTNNTGKILTDYQLKISLDTATMVSASRLQSDCDDLRFADISGQELPYWIESGCNSATTKIWVKASKVPLGSSIIYVYYGNSTATAGQNGDATFELFDDFLSPNLNYSKWDAIAKGTGGTFGVTSAGEATFSPTPSTVSSANLKSKKTFTNAIAIEIRRKQNTDNSYMHFSFGGGIMQDSVGTQTIWTDALLSNGYYWRGQSAALGSISSVAQGSAPSSLVGLSSVTASFATYGRYQYVYDSAGGLWWLVDDVYKMSATNTTYQSNAKNILITYGEWSTGQGDGGSVDWVFVRKIAGTPTVSEPSVGSFGTAETGEAPVAYWKFDEGYGATVYDESTSANDGTIVNATWQTDDSCKMGKCLSLNGTSGYVSATTRGFPSGAFSGMTTTMWIKANEIPANTYIFHYGICTANTQWSIFGNNGGIGFSNCGTGDISSRQKVSVGEWIFIAAVYDGSRKYIYWNGVLDSSIGYSSFNITYATVYLGSYEGSGNFFNGSIDDVKVYPYARTATQIKKDYASGRLKNTTSGSGTGVSAGAQNQSYKTEGLVGHWKMDEASWAGTASEVRDYSGLGNHGTAVGAGGITGTSSTAKYGKSGDFDGTDDYVTISHSNSISPANALTISAWLRVTTNTGNKYILSKGTTSNGYHLYNDPNSNKGISFFLAGDGAAIGSGSTCLGIWCHIVGTWDGITEKIYLDGVLKNQQIHSSAITYASDILTLGNYNGATNFSNVLLDDVRLYNRALSGAEIRRLYNDAPPPVLHLKLDEGTGQYAFDNSGRSATGTLGSAATAGSDDPTWASASTCKFGGCMSFDGGDFLGINPVPSALNITGPITLSTWAYYNGTSAGIMGKSAFNFDYGDYTLYYNVDSVTANFSGPGGINSGVSAVTANRWYHISATYDGASAKIYIDGILKASGARSGPISNTYSQFRLGQWYAPPSYNLTGGMLDDVRIYDYARTATQIREDMMAGAPIYTSPRYSVAPNAPNSSTNNSGMVAYWKFDEGTTSTLAYDSTANGNDGTYVGSVSSTPGKFGKAISFDRTVGVVSTNGFTGISAGGTITASVWVKPTIADGSQGVILNGSTVRVRLETRETNKYQALFGSSSTWCNGTVGAIGGRVIPGQWVHLTGVYDNSNQILYVDGVEVGRAPCALAIANSGNIDIGGCCGGYNFAGKIDELKIYNVALTADEIKADYNKGKAMMLGGASSEDSVAANGSGDRPAQSSASGRLVGWWKMDEKSGQYARDASGSGNNGTLGASAPASTDDPTWKRPPECHSGSCLSFDGGDFVTSTQRAISGNSAFTMALWVKANPASLQMISNFGNIGTYTNANIIIQLTYKCGFYGTSIDTGVVPDGKWHHITYTYNPTGTLQTCYIDGVSKGTQNTITPNITGTVFALGVLPNGTLPFTGLMDDVKLWNYALNVAEIAYEYNRGKPVAHWKFDEGQGNYAYDASGNGNHGYVVIGTGGTQTTTSSAWTAGSSGKFNGGMSFDGVDDYVNAGNSSLLNFSGLGTSFSVSFWSKTSASNINKGVMGKWSTANGNQWAFVDGLSATGKIGFYIYDTGVNGVVSNNALNNGVWHHLAGVANNGIMRLYVDGNVQNIADTYNTISASTGNVYLGTYGLAGVEQLYWSGSIDDVRIYNYALSASQIREVYNNGKSVYFK